MNNYRKLKVWQKAMDLAKECYRITENFPSRELYGLSAQVRKSAVSIPSNIAEGSARRHRKEFLRFLSIAQGSLAELETQIMLAQRLGYIDEESLAGFLGKTEEIGKMISGLRKALIVDS